MWLHLFTPCSVVSFMRASTPCVPRHEHRACIVASASKYESKDALKAAFKKFEQRFAALKAGEAPDEEDALNEAFSTFEAKFADLKSSQQQPEARHDALAEAFATFEAKYAELEQERQEAAMLKELEPRVIAFTRGSGPCRIYVGGIPFGMTEGQVA